MSSPFGNALHAVLSFCGISIFFWRIYFMYFEFLPYNIAEITRRAPSNKLVNISDENPYTAIGPNTHTAEPAT